MARKVSIQDCRIGNIYDNTEDKYMNIENQDTDKQFLEEKFVDEQLIKDLTEIYEDLKDEELKNENYNSVIFAGYFIQKFKDNNIDIEDITIGLIDELKNRRSYPLWHILECVNTVYEFYEPEMSDKYIVVCYIDNEEIMYCKAKIIGNIDDLDLSRSDLELCDVEKVIDLDSDEYIAGEDLSEYHGRNRILKAMATIRNEFPIGTQFITTNL